jgi:NAD-dependent dihydropyrimidine dehydrogenase PreA subunit
VAYIIAEPCIGTKDTACVDACPVDCIHPKKDTQYEDAARGSNRLTSSLLTLSSASTVAPAYQSARFRRFSRWMTFPRSGTPTLRRTPATSKEAISSRTNTGQRRPSTAALCHFTRVHELAFPFRRRQRACSQAIPALAVHNRISAWPLSGVIGPSRKDTVDANGAG